MFKGLCLEVYLHCHKTILEEYYWFLYQPEWAGIYSGNRQSQVFKVYCESEWGSRVGFLFQDSKLKIKALYLEHCDYKGKKDSEFHKHFSRQPLTYHWAKQVTCPHLTPRDQRHAVAVPCSKERGLQISTQH